MLLLEKDVGIGAVDDWVETLTRDGLDFALVLKDLPIDSRVFHTTQKMAAIVRYRARKAATRSEGNRELIRARYERLGMLEIGQIVADVVEALVCFETANNDLPRDVGLPDQQIEVSVNDCKPLASSTSESEQSVDLQSKSRKSHVLVRVPKINKTGRRRLLCEIGSRRVKLLPSVVVALNLLAMGVLRIRLHREVLGKFPKELRWMARQIKQDTNALVSKNKPMYIVPKGMEKYIELAEENVA